MDPGSINIYTNTDKSYKHKCLLVLVNFWPYVWLFGGKWKETGYKKLSLQYLCIIINYVWLSCSGLCSIHIQSLQQPFRKGGIKVFWIKVGFSKNRVLINKKVKNCNQSCLSSNVSCSYHIELYSQHELRFSDSFGLVRVDSTVACKLLNRCAENIANLYD